VKILFLTGSLEPGKDGVGDYSRNLAAECARLGHQVFLLSLNDPWVDAQVSADSLLRLGSKLPWQARAKAAHSFVAQTQPELVSLQFVPYSFHPAGLNFALSPILRAIVGRTTAHMMFHELWIGEQAGAPLKNRVFGFFQRKIAEGVIKNLGCRLIHTSNSVYVELLSRYGIPAKLLPLFGNIPIVEREFRPSRQSDFLQLAMFGSVHPEWSPEKMFAQLATFRKRIRLSHVGRIGVAESSWNRFVERHGAEVEFQRLGERAPEEVSRFFFSVDFGVSTTPLSLIGKSGCVAAMLEHGLPVIVNRDDVHFSGIRGIGLTSDLLIPLDEGFLERLTSIKRQPPKPRLPEVAAQFLSDIGA
jgi:hypothetical protein